MIEEDRKATDERRKAMESAMVKYGGNHWWDSNDLVTVAIYQLFERTLLVSFSVFHEGIEKLLGWPVFTHEFGGLNIKGLKEEACDAVHRLEKEESLERSQEYKDDAVRRCFESLATFCTNNGKELLVVRVENKK